MPQQKEGRVLGTVGKIKRQRIGKRVHEGAQTPTQCVHQKVKPLKEKQLERVNINSM